MALCLALLSCSQEGGGQLSVAPQTSPTSTQDPGSNPDPGGGANRVAGSGNSVENAEFEELFSFDSIKTVRIYISGAEWGALLNDYDENNRNEVYRVADFLYGSDAAIAERINNVGFRLRGNLFSRARPQDDEGFRRVHFKVKFNERFDEDEGLYGSPSTDIAEISSNRGRLFRTVRSLNFKHNRGDSSYLREVFAADAFHRFGLRGARTIFARLLIKIGDERERDFGVYNMTESLDSSWTRRQFDGDNAFLFKCLWQGYGPADLSVVDTGLGGSQGSIGMEITDPADSASLASFEAYRPSYDLKTRDGSFDEAEAELNKLIRLLQGSPSKAQLEAALDITSVLKAQALAVFIGKWDGYWRNGNNYYLALHPDADKWIFLPYDNDLVFEDDFINGMYPGARNLEDQPFVKWGDRPFNDMVDSVLMDHLLDIPEFKQMYLGYVAELVHEEFGIFHPDNVRQRLTMMRNLIDDYAGKHSAHGEAVYNGSFSDILNFVTNRAAVARAESGAGLRRRAVGALRQAQPGGLGPEMR